MVETPEINWDQKTEDEEKRRKKNERKNKEIQYREFRRRLINEIIEGIAWIVGIIGLICSVLIGAYYLGCWFPDERSPISLFLESILLHLTTLPIKVQILYLAEVAVLVILFLLCALWIMEEENKD